jgi:hypothetical protein
MKKSYAAIAASLAMLALSSTANAIGPVAISAFQPVQVGNSCAFFQVTGSNIWYSLVVSDASFTSQFGFIMAAFYSGTPVTFGTSGTACGNFPRIQWIYVGTAM